MLQEVCCMEDKKNSLYDIFLNYSYSQLKQMLKKAETEDEKNFYMTLANLVLQKEQEKVIGE